MTITRESTDSTTAFPIRALTATALVVATAVGPTLVPPASATASSTASSDLRHARPNHRIVHHDARHDVLHFDFESDTARPAPRDRATDITTTVVDHRDGQLVVKAGARRLSRAGYRWMVAEILTSDRKRFTLAVDYSSAPIGPRVSLERFATAREVRCPGASWSINRTARRIAASIPTSCLGTPAWVRVGVGLTAAPHNLETAWADDSRVRGRIGDRHLELGPRQHRA
jgi:hypothetical protein